MTNQFVTVRTEKGIHSRKTEKSAGLRLNTESGGQSLRIREIVDGGMTHHFQEVLNNTISGFLRGNLSVGMECLKYGKKKTVK